MLEKNKPEYNDKYKISSEVIKKLTKLPAP